MASYNPSAFGPLTPEQAVQAIKNVPYGNTVTEHYLLFWDSAQSQYWLSYYQSATVNCTGSVYARSGANRIQNSGGTAYIAINVNAQGAVTGWQGSAGAYTNYEELAGVMSGYTQDWSTANVYSTIHLNVPENPAYSLDPTQAPDERFFAKNVEEYSFNVGVAAEQASTYDSSTHIYMTSTYKITLRWTSPVSGEDISIDLDNLVYNTASVISPPISPFYAYDCLYGISNIARAYRMPLGGYTSAADIPSAWAELTDKRSITTMTLQELKDKASTQLPGITNNDLFTEIYADFKDQQGTIIETKSISYASLFGEDIDINSSTVQDPNELPTLPDDNRYTDAIDLTVPTLTGTGVFNRCYVLDANGVNDLCDYLYNADDSIFDEIIDGVLTRGDPIESLIDLRLYPFDVRTFTGAGTSEAIKFGRTNTGIIGIKLPHNSNAVISLGSCTVHRYFNCFLDYLSTLQLYIPFCGVCDLPIDRVLNHRLSIKLIVDYVTGACTAVVYCDDLPLLYRPGVIGVSIPMTATNSAELGKTIVGNLVKGAEGAISKNPAAVISAAEDTAGKLFDGSSIQSVGSSSPQTALFQPKDAYLLISQVVPASGVYDSVYGELVGYACFTPVSAISERVGTGFNVFDNVKLNINTATEAEREEILDYLTSGVFL